VNDTLPTLHVSHTCGRVAYLRDGGLRALVSGDEINGNGDGESHLSRSKITACGVGCLHAPTCKGGAEAACYLEPGRGVPGPSMICLAEIA